MTFVTIDDIPIINKRKKHKKRNNSYKRKRKNKNNKLSNKYGKQKKSPQNNKYDDDETRFNSEEYHKKQHDL